MTLGETIQAKRTALGLSQEALAERVGVSRQAVSKWEVGDAVPDTDKLVPLARALGVSVDELLGNVPEGPPPEEKEEHAAPGQKGPGWFALHWYWLGLLDADSAAGDAVVPGRCADDLLRGERGIYGYQHIRACFDGNIGTSGSCSAVILRAAPAGHRRRPADLLSGPPPRAEKIWAQVTFHIKIKLGPPQSNLRRPHNVGRISG